MSYEAFKFAEKMGWDARAATYDDFTGRVTTGAIPKLLAMAELAPGKRILDLCCGTGRAAGAASALGADAEGIDVSAAMVKAAQSAFPAASFATGDAEAIQKDDAVFDAVICSFGIMHVGSTETMFNEISRVLKSGGRVALSHWIGPPESPLFRIIFGVMQRLADMSVVPPSPPPFALSSDDAMRGALEAAGFGEFSSARLPLVFKAPKGQFANHFRRFAARAAVILDGQNEDVLKEIYASWETQLEEFVDGDEYHVPMPAIVATAVRGT